MSFSLDGLARAVKASLPRLPRGSALGVDIGTSSVKVVQLATHDDSIVLETYGEIALSRYGGSTVPGGTQLQPEIEADALADLIHEIRATARTGGIALQQAAALTTLAEFPKRDEAQLRKIIGTEAHRFIPVPMSTVTLDWVVVPDMSAEIRAFDQMQDSGGVEAHKQKVLLVASDNAAASARMKAARLAGIEPDFFEVEMFGIVRACKPHVSEPTLVIDMGASTTKIYIADERGMPIAAHVLSSGGTALTAAIASSFGWDRAQAETAKCEHAWQEGGSASKQERDTIIKIISAYIGDTFEIARGMIDEHSKSNPRRITRVIISGGGSDLCVPEIREHIRTRFGTDVTIAEPFSPIQTPMILDDTIRRFGARYTVAVGLALRALS